MPVEEVQVLIVGGGIAGLSTALHLARAGLRGIVVLEREPLPGTYASGHNAGIARQLTGRAAHTALTTRGRALLAEAGLVGNQGGHLLAAAPGGIDALAAEAEAFGLPATRRPGSPFKDLEAAEDLHIPTDGIIDGQGLLLHCLEGARAAGAQVRFGCGAREIRPLPEGFEVATDQGAFRASLLVNAAGAWAQAVGRDAGGLDIPFAPLRRHLVWSAGSYPQDRPYTWWADRPLYIRPESGGLLLCACEEQRVDPPAAGLQPSTDETVLEGLAASLADLAPGLVEVPITRTWSGLRTFAPDRTFVVGRDPVNPRLFWVAGLGGHGMTSGLAVGELAARALQGQADPGPLDPRRLLTH